MLIILGLGFSVCEHLLQGLGLLNLCALFWDSEPKARTLFYLRGCRGTMQHEKLALVV